MNAQTLQRLLQLLVTGPLMLKQSGQLKNKYFKVAVGAGGIALVMMAIHGIMEDKKAANRKAALLQQQKLNKIFVSLDKK